MCANELSKMNKLGRIIYFIMLSLFFISIIIQFFLAGLAVFVNPENWMKHIMFVHLFGFNIPLFLLLFAYVGKFPKRAYWSIFGMIIGVFSMYYTANAASIHSWIGALHPVIAVLLFIITYQELRRVMKILFIHKKGEK